MVVGYYVREKFKHDIEPTQKEVEDIYISESEVQGVPVDQAEMFIKQQLQQQKLQIKIRDLVEKLRDEKGIRKNSELLEKEQKKLLSKPIENK